MCQPISVRPKEARQLEKYAGKLGSCTERSGYAQRMSVQQSMPSVLGQEIYEIDRGNAASSLICGEEIATQGQTMVELRKVLMALVGGIAITLVTGLMPNTPGMLAGASWYGYPLAWLIRMVVAPEYFPWKVEGVGLVVDIVVWTLIMLVILLVAMRKPKSPAEAESKATQ